YNQAEASVIFCRFAGHANETTARSFFSLRAISIYMGLRNLTITDRSVTTIVIRLMVGVVFVSEGIQKFIFPDKLGSGRFAKIGLPGPEFLGPFVGSFEIVCGSLVLIGLLTRLAVIPLIIKIGRGSCRGGTEDD